MHLLYNRCIYKPLSIRFEIAHRLWPIWFTNMSMIAIFLLSYAEQYNDWHLLWVCLRKIQEMKADRQSFETTNSFMGGLRRHIHQDLMISSILLATFFLWTETNDWHRHLDMGKPIYVPIIWLDFPLEKCGCFFYNSN